MTDAEELKVIRPWMQVIDLILALGLQEIDRLPSAWVHQVDADWLVLVNPHAQECVIPACSHRQERRISPHTMYFEFQGQPMAIISPTQWVQLGSLESGRALMAALDRAIIDAMGAGGRA